MRRIPELIISLLVIVVIAFVIQFSASRERLAVEGREIFLELAPVDPLSLLQGQYMQVSFAVEREGVPVDEGQNFQGKLAVLSLDERGVAKFVGVEANNDPEPDQVLFRGHLRKMEDYVKLEIPQRTFLFKENTEDLYESAKYGVFRVGEDGDFILMDLADENLQKLTLLKN